jgi:hypothetical protein
MGRRAPPPADLEEDPRTLSFFEGPDDYDHASRVVDRKICRQVFGLYLKSSTEHGHEVKKIHPMTIRNDAKRAALRDTSDYAKNLKLVEKRSETLRAPPTPTPEETPMPTKEDQLSERDQQTLKKYRQLEDKHGRPPSNLELGRACGVTSDNEASVAQRGYILRKPLVAAGLLSLHRGAGATQSAPRAARAPRTTHPQPAPSTALAIVPRVPPPPSSFAALEGLRHEHARLVRRAEATASAIRLLEEAEG